ncbi:MAG TPA: AAA family ATPase, partial [Candidatus Aminicenantes bacterium]|nr:AAA family ATPase [Candidatus Aminicenantes bacterium]
DEADILEALADFAQLPKAGFSLSFKERLAHLPEAVGRRIIGQANAVARVTDGVITARLGYQVKRDRPSGIFLFVGPTGVGKTETALVLAEELFGSRDSLIRIDMSEYMERFTYSRFVGAAPGYVGYYDSNQLTDKVRQNPYSVILLDEIEKADAQLLNIFLQVFDAGRLTDARGNAVDFSKSTIIMTSNIGTALFSRTVPGFSSPTAVKVPRTAMIKALKRHFAPEFLNRIDEIVVFSHLTSADMRHIVTLQLAEVRGDLERQGHELILPPEVIDHLATIGYSPEYGARNLMRTLQTELLTPLAHASFEREWEGSQRVVAALEEGKITISLDGAPVVPVPSAWQEHRERREKG